jgi:hypothetical protein
LLATFDESWLSRSGVDSVAAFPGLGPMLDGEYALVGKGDYWFYRRKEA